MRISASSEMPASTVIVGGRPWIARIEVVDAVHRGQVDDGAAGILGGIAVSPAQSAGDHAVAGFARVLVSASPTSPAVAGWLTSARVAAVMPQPVSSCWLT